MDAISGHIYWGHIIGRVITLYVESNISLCLPYLVEESTLSIGSFRCRVVNVFVVSLRSMVKHVVVESVCYYVLQ